MNKYTDNGDGTVTDHETGLMWAKASIGQHPLTCEGRAGRLTLGEAVEEAKKSNLAGFKDWRVPTDKELLSIVHYGKTNPSIDGSYFPNTPPSFFWSSSLFGDNASILWGVHFRNGSDNCSSLRDSGGRVRLVRSSQ